MTGEECLELSVVAPVFNEALTLGMFLDSLAGQQQVAFEVIICDGGSDDGTPALALELEKGRPFPVTVIMATGGRGAQLNAGAEAGRAPNLLFLHADSRFDDPMSLRKGLDCLAAAIASRGHERLAGRFRLRFDRSDPTPSLGYYFYEWKARLNRAECIHGDQGFLLRKSFFASVGPFPEAFPMLAETSFAGIARGNGEWLLLPADIYTSARRFEVEGLQARQTLNAIIMNFAALDWQPFFRAIPSLYSQHGQSHPLALAPILRSTAALIRALPLRERLLLWYRTGGYVRANAWQFAFALDAWRGFRRGIPVSAGTTPLLNFYDRRLDCLTNHPPGQLVAAGIVWLWLRYRLGGAG
jgi:glycosyltransferase involved in cell wall biosynthesis